jgi:hypothetical protein
MSRFFTGGDTSSEEEEEKIEKKEGMFLCRHQPNGMIEEKNIDRSPCHFIRPYWCTY